jgi:OOP family OmpA-OmpF porin
MMDGSADLNLLTKAHLKELRKIIVGLDEEDLKRLRDLVSDPDHFSEYIVNYLPLSIKKLINSGTITIEDLSPFIEQAIHESIRKDPQGLADILYPVMGPAIRKAVSEDIKRMLESVNSAVEHSFSLKRLGWRLQALFSGKSYAEIVLAHAYVYRVRQVFLIHRQTGLLLHDAADSEKGIAQDADMVSSMLSAIKDFVNDSLDVEKQEGSLETIQMGEYTIWVEQGPHAILAAIIEGRAPEDLKLVMKEALESVHVNFIRELENFEGDTEPFEKTDRFLKMCLRKQEKEKKKKKPIGLIFVALLLLVVLGRIVYHCADDRMRFSKFMTELRDEPGIYISDVDNHFIKHTVKGLKDPFAVDPYAVGEKYGFDTSSLTFDLKPYISLDDRIILKRIRQKMNLPSSFKLAYKNGILYVNGPVDDKLKVRFNNEALTVPGVSRIVFKQGEKVKVTPKKIKKEIFDIEKIFFVFRFNEVKLDSVQKIKFDKLIKKINTVYDFSFNQDSVPVIIVRAFTSNKGNTEANKEVAFSRAKQFIDLMVEAGVPMETLVPKIVIKEESDDPYPVRSVSFRVIYVKPEEL